MKIKTADVATRFHEGEAGFSLIELLVVMVVTFFVSGAIYALLSSGQNSFRREPEIADRQQNIRVAMDVINQDIANAGTNLPAFVQVFTNVDPGGGAALNGLGPLGAIGDPILGLNSDVLEIVAAEDRCPASTVCSNIPAGTVTTYPTKEKNPSCLAPAGVANPGLAVLTDNNFMIIQPIVGPAAAQCPAGGSTNNGGVSLGAPVAIGPNPVAPTLTAPAVGTSIYSFIVPARVSRYMIGFDPQDPDRVPLLYRSVTGRYAVAALGATSVGAAPPNSPTGPAAGANWQVVARGIEDLQVEYQDGLGIWTNTPPTAIPCGPPGITGGCANQASFDAIVRQVRVTLSARVTGQGPLQGSTNAAGGAPNRVRGRLVSITQPRAAMTALEMGNQIR